VRLIPTDREAPLVAAEANRADLCVTRDLFEDDYIKSLSCQLYIDSRVVTRCDSLEKINAYITVPPWCCDRFKFSCAWIVNWIWWLSSLVRLCYGCICSIVFFVSVRRMLKFVSLLQII